MFQKSLNRAVLTLRVTTETPLLIRAGDSGLNPVAADLACVRTAHVRMGSTVYIPGSSLRGVIRSSAEAAVRGHDWGGIQGACDPLDHKKNCASKVPKKASTAEVHAAHCLACRLFGSTEIKARIAVRDHFPWNSRANESAQRDMCAVANQTELRHGVAINRLSGAVQHGPFEQEMVPAGSEFYGDIAIENFQAWQLGLLAVGLDEINEGFAQLGSSKSRGLGAVKISVQGILYEQVRRAGSVAAGVGILDSEAKQPYGLLADAEFPTEAKPEIFGLANRWTLDAAAAKRWVDVGRDALGELG